ncbi:MAG: HAMP domain-containing sensor histidine kinase [Arcobacteraceae bacterium]|nr:HAMP domain-containing sensor histidine kinase [Arcobacteraceae bacterium]
MFLFSGEKKTAFMVLGIYWISTFFLLASINITYFSMEKIKFRESIKAELTSDAKSLASYLEILHNQYNQEMIYPRFNTFESAIYDSDKNLIFSTFKENISFEETLYSKGGFTYCIIPQTPYYLGTASIVIKKKTKNFIDVIDKKILVLPILLFLIIVLTSFILIRIILKPLKNNIDVLNKFIKDTTHELNTPIATIQSNLELLENSTFDDKVTKRIQRIKSATISIKNLYEDLVFLTLNKSLKSSLIMVNINEIMQTRIEYFSLLFKSKSLVITINQNAQTTLFIDEVKITRVIDNLLSNAIKYTHKNKNITITIEEKSFSIQDEGIGMSEVEVSQVFQRYTRFDTSEIGFGIGYNIVYRVIKEYGLKIEIDSQKGIGTCVKISW